MEQDIRDPAWLAQEQRWLAAARGGDAEALAGLWAAFAGPLYREVLLPRLRDPTLAEDLLSDTFWTALQRIDGTEDRGRSLWFWLARVAINKVHDLHRQRGRRAEALARAAAAPLPPAGLLPGGGAAPDEPLAQGELQRRVQDCLATLNPRYRRAIELRFLEDRERGDCAAALDVSLGTFDVLLLRSLRSFRSAWETQLEKEETP